jgi:MoaA/NifB/PqqE/SkfB family radical SAM enzyme
MSALHFDLRPLVRRLYPDDVITRRLLQRPLPLTRARLRALWSLLRNLVFEERLRFHRWFTPSKPNGVAIEITNACNLRCKMCNLVAMQRRPRIMQFDVYQRIVDRCVALGVDNVRLHTYGETLLHPRLEEMLRYAVRKGLKVWISTNGQMLDEDTARMLLASGVSAVRFSVEGGQAATYEDIRAGGSWDRLQANLQRFRRLRDELNPAVFIGLNTVVMRQTFDEIDRIQAVFGPYVDEIEFSPLEGLGAQGRRLGEGRWIERHDESRRIPCRLLWDMMNISVDGKATLCCADVEAEVPVGDALGQDLSAIWKGPALRAAREAHRGRRFTGICEHCTFGTTNTAVNRFRYALLNDRPSYGGKVR